MPNDETVIEEKVEHAEQEEPTEEQKNMAQVEVRDNVPIDFNKTLKDFHWIYYHGHGLTMGNANIGNPMSNAKWMGLSIGKCPMDLMVYQEILFDTRPDIIIEAGTAAGGSALFLAQMCELMGTGAVITIDIKQGPYYRPHPRLNYLQADITTPDTYEYVRRAIAATDYGRAMFIFDDDHHKDHVLEEMEMYAELVSPGCFMIVEDTNINGNPVYPEYGPGPKEAVLDFVNKHPEFMPDYSKHKFLMTCNPGGYLRRI